MSDFPVDLFSRTSRVIEQGIADHLHRGVQLFVSRNFQVLLDAALGEDAPGIPLTSDLILPWLSAGKPLTAALIMQRVESGQLQLDQSVASIIPEFAASGKEHVTLQDLLTHSAGLKPIATSWPKRTWREIVEKICQSGIRRDAAPAAYDPARSWFILGEVLQRIDSRQRRIDQIMREDLLLPLGMTHTWLAIPKEVLEEVRPGLGRADVVQNGLLTPAPLNTDEYCLAPSPGGSVRGPIRELARFYEMLLRGGSTAEGQVILRLETVRMMTRRVRQGELDVTFQHVVDFGLGLIINSNRYGAETVPYGFGRYASEDSFGHGGSQSSIGFADPAVGLVVTAVANGQPGEDRHNQRFRDLNTAIYEDLGLDRLIYPTAS